MAECIERTGELVLAMNAGARAIENTRRYHGAVYIKNVFSEDAQEIPYLLAAKVLREVSDAPTVDAVVVTRCKDCKHLCVLNRKDMYAFCSKTNIAFLRFEQDTRTFFCGFGERKDGGNADENREPESQG